MAEFVGLLATINDDRWDHMHSWGGSWMWLWGIAMMALFVIVVAWLVRATTRNGAPSSPPTDPTDRAREILAERYARGELTTEEYRERVGQLS